MHFQKSLHERNKESDRSLPVINADCVAVTAVGFLREVMQHRALCERMVVWPSRTYWDLLLL